MATESTNDHSGLVEVDQLQDLGKLTEVCGKRMVCPSENDDFIHGGCSEHLCTSMKGKDQIQPLVNV